MGTSTTMGTPICVRVPTHILDNQVKIYLENDDGPATEKDTGTTEDHTLRTNVHIKDKIGKEPLKLIYQNIRGLITENSKVKKDYFEEFVKENNVIIMNFTETWLNETIKEDANINEFQCFRVDRIDRSRGGAAIYIRDQVEANIISKVNSGKCEMLAINLEHLNTINIVIYRPPDTALNTFKSIIQEI